jgi:hypothetical protein
MADTITLKCKECGNTVERRKHCPYTGIEHGRGWVYICDCRGEMEVIDIIPDSPYLCDILDDGGDTAMIPWKIFRKSNDDDKPIWGKGILEICKAAGKMMDEAEVPEGERVLKMWTFNDDSVIK